jgi:hypothetical protein
MSCRRSVIIVDTNEYQLIGCMGWVGSSDFSVIACFKHNWRLLEEATRTVS